jgi:hypothetical protein
MKNIEATTTERVKMKEKTSQTDETTEQDLIVIVRVCELS